MSELSPDYLSGVIAPMLTPIHQDGSLDLPGAEAFVEWLISRQKVRTIFARSGMGKMFTFTVEETKQFSEAVVRAAKGRIGVVVGASGEWTTRDVDRTVRPDSAKYLNEAIELTLHVQKIGADAAVHVVPEAIVPENGESIAEAVFRYYQTVHDATSIPILLYQPGGILPEYCLTPDLLRRLMTLPRFVGMKISTGQDSVFAPLAEVARENPAFALIAGNETYYLRALEQGAVGVIGEGCNVYPEILDAIKSQFLNGNKAGAEEAQHDVLRALDLTTGLDGATIWKQFIRMHGIAIEAFDRSKAPLASEEIVKLVTYGVHALLEEYKD